MSRRPPTDPRSPVQEGGSGGPVTALAVLALAVLIGWAVQQDWTEDPLPPPIVSESGTTPAPGPLAAAPGEPTRAKANLAGLFSEDDYPFDAIRNAEQGAVAYRLTVSPEGRVTGCAITAVSGSASLDRTTCEILTRRARFEPARNADGEAVADVVTGRVRWVLPPG